MRDFKFYRTAIVENNDSQYRSIYKAIHNIATRVIDGSHLMLGDYNAIVYFREVFKADPNVGALFDNLYQNYSIMPIPSFLTFYIEIVKEKPCCRRVDGICIGQRIFNHYLNIDTTNTTLLVGEDLNDTKFYGYILKWYIAQESKNVGYAFHGVNGGGINTYKVVQNELRENHITICIVDTDKRFPNCSPKSDGTYGKCKENIKSTDLEYKFLPLHVHEVENLIPLNFIDLFSIWEGQIIDKNNKKAFDYLRVDAADILPYFDYKNGIKNDKYFFDNPDYYAFAKKCYTMNVEMMANESDFDYYVRNNRTKEIYPRLLKGTNTILRTLDIIQKDNCPQPILLEYQTKYWNEIGQSMLDWCIARKKEAIS